MGYKIFFSYRNLFCICVFGQFVVKDSRLVRSSLTSYEIFQEIVLEKNRL
jgi:hypothetical protein